MNSRLSQLVLALALSGCAGVDVSSHLQQTSLDIAAPVAVSLANTPERLALSQQLLAQPVDQAAALRLLVINSSAWQALVAAHLEQASAAAHSGMLANPVFRFERLSVGDELDIGRSVSLGLLDVLSWPWRHKLAAQQVELTRLKLAFELMLQLDQTRNAWVEAVAANGRLELARRHAEAAGLGFELVQKMHQAGSVSALQLARQQVQALEAAHALTQAENQALARREQLARLLGLTPAQARQWRLVEHLAPLPPQPLPVAQLAASFKDKRLDVRLAEAQLKLLAGAENIDLVQSFSDVELELHGGSRFSDSGGGGSSGYALAIRLPLFDFGHHRRDQISHRLAAARYRLEATLGNAASELSQAYAAYRSAYDIARSHSQQLSVLKKTIQQEQLLRYNAMLIGPLELLASYRAQVDASVQALSALENFYRAEAQLEAALMGKSLNPVPAESATKSFSPRPHD